MRVRSIWVDLLGRDDLTDEDNFFEVGGTSLSAVRLLARIAKECGHSVGLGEFFERPTIMGMLDLTTRKAPVSTVVRLTPAVAGPAVYLVHPAGCFVSSYAQIAAALATDCDVHGLQAAGLTDATAPDSTVEQMAARYLADIGDHIGENAYCLAGWSAGGLVAFEMARQLVAAGAAVGQLVLLDSAPPGFYAEPDDEIGVLAEIASGIDGEDHAGELRGLSPDGRLGLVARLVREEFGGQPPGADEVRRYCDLYRTHLLARGGYRARRADVAITLVQPASEPRRSGGRAERAWADLAGLGVETTLVPGNHRTMVTGAGAAAIADLIRASLAVFR